MKVKISFITDGDVSGSDCRSQIQNTKIDIYYRNRVAAPEGVLAAAALELP